MEEQAKNGNAAASLMDQFIAAGLVRQEEEGSWVVANDGSASKFRPAEDH